MKVIVMRGISGAGKSTWIKNNYPNAVVVSADHDFIQPDGTYDHGAANRHDAHKRCYQEFIQAMQSKAPLIIVDNGNRYVWEISPYVMPAQSFGCEVEIMTIECDPETAIRRKNWVPADEVRKQAIDLKDEEQRFPDFMKMIHRKISADETVS